MALINMIVLFLAGFVCSINADCLGCPNDEDVNGPVVQNYLKTTLTQFKAPPKGTDNELTTLIRVTRVTSQVVSGILYNYEFEAKGVKSHQLYTCQLVVLSQPWAAGDVVQKYECKPLYLNSLQQNDKVCIGCPKEHNVEDKVVQQHLKTTLSFYKAPPQGTDNELTSLRRVTRVTSQIVAGMKYTYEFEAKGVKTHKLYTCELVVVSQLWAAGDIVEKYECQPLYMNSIQQKENSCPGCPEEHDVKNKAVQHYLQTTLTQYKAPAKGTDNELTTLFRVTRATTQVVAGMLYTYDFEARGVKTHKLYTCHMVVLSQPWAVGDVVQEYECKPLHLNMLEHLIQNTCPGCPVEHDVKDQDVQKFLQTTLTQYRAPAKGTDNELTTLVRVTRAKTQVVSGILYTYDFEAKGVKTHKLYTCHMVVLSQPWATGDVVKEYQCQPLYL